MSQVSKTHIIWDWNGTIFDDGGALINATIDAFKARNLCPVTVETYQRHNIQPISLFYERLAGRALSEEDQRALDDVFWPSYARHSRMSTLALDARQALATWRDAGGTQSLLSLFPREKLLPVVWAEGIGDFFSRIDAPSEAGHPEKASRLREHMRHLAVPAGQVLLIGDSLDDVIAARACGVGCAVYHSGATALHSRERFAGMSVPVVDSLMAGVLLARDGIAPVRQNQ